MVSAFKLLWSTNIPNNIQAFTWILLQNMIQRMGELLGKHNLVYPICWALQNHTFTFSSYALLLQLFGRVQVQIWSNKLSPCDLLEDRLLDFEVQTN